MMKNTITALLLSLLWINLAVAATDYVLGTGDVVKITVYDHPDLTSVTRIGESGRVSFPLIGEVKLGDHTISDAEAKLARYLKEGEFVRNPQVSINVEQFRSQQVSILGSVNKPGKYSIETSNALVDMLAFAGGINSEGADRVRVIKQGSDGAVTQLDADLVKLFKFGDTTQNLAIGNGDVIFVPRMDRFYIYGEVQKPGVYRLERRMLVMQALAVAGGLTARGTEKNIKVRRHSAAGQVETIDASALDELQNDDVVFIKESLF